MVENWARNFQKSAWGGGNIHSDMGGRVAIKLEK